jgi:hypothetical protein
MSGVDPVQTIQRMPSREKAICMQILDRLLRWPPGAPPSNEQVADWLRAEGAAESVVSSYLRSTSPVTDKEVQS